MEHILKPGTKILILAGYCQDEKNYPLCTDDLPCIECLQMDNIGILKNEVLVDVIGGWEYLKVKQEKEG